MSRVLADIEELTGQPGGAPAPTPATPIMPSAPSASRVLREIDELTAQPPAAPVAPAAPAAPQAAPKKPLTQRLPGTPEYEEFVQGELEKAKRGEVPPALLRDSASVLDELAIRKREKQIITAPGAGYPLHVEDERAILSGGEDVRKWSVEQLQKRQEVLQGQVEGLQRQGAADLPEPEAAQPHGVIMSDLQAMIETAEANPRIPDAVKEQVRDLLSPAVAPEAWERAGEIGVGEKLARKDWAAWLPVVGVAFDVAHMRRTKEAAERLQEEDREPGFYKELEGREMTGTLRAAFGGPLRTADARQAADEAIVTRFLLDVAETDARGVTWPAVVAEGVVNLLPYMIEFALTAGAATIAKGAVQTGSKMALRKLGVHLAGRFAKRIAASKGVAAAARLTNMAARAAIGGAVRAPMWGVAEIEERQIPVMELGRRGKIIFQREGETPAQAVLHGLLSGWIEAATEEMGQEIFGPLGRAAADKLAAKVPLVGKLLSHLDDLRGKVPRLAALSKSAGYSDLISEMGEEQAGRTIRAVIGLGPPGSMDEARGILERLAASVPSVGELLTEGAILVAPALLRLGAGVAARPAPPAAPPAAPVPAVPVPPVAVPAAPAPPVAPPAAEAAPPIAEIPPAPAEAAAPKVRGIDALVEKYNASGRVAVRYPRKGTISVDGRTMSQADAIEKMKSVLGSQPPPVPAEAAPAKEPWEMTREEFASTAKVRPGEEVRSIGFGEWLDTKGIPRTVIVGDAERATYIGQQAFPTSRTRHQRGKQDTIKKRVMREDVLLEQYHQEVPAARPERPLDLERRQDTAWVRTQHRRSLVKALAAGKPVPPAVLADYPDLAAQAAPAPPAVVSREGVSAEDMMQAARKVFGTTEDENEALYLFADGTMAAGGGGEAEHIHFLRPTGATDVVDFGRTTGTIRMRADDAEVAFEIFRSPSEAQRRTMLRLAGERAEVRVSIDATTEGVETYKTLFSWSEQNPSKMAIAGAIRAADAALAQAVPAKVAPAVGVEPEVAPEAEYEIINSRGNRTWKRTFASRAEAQKFLEKKITSAPGRIQFMVRPVEKVGPPVGPTPEIAPEAPRMPQVERGGPGVQEEGVSPQEGGIAEAARGQEGAVTEEKPPEPEQGFDFLSDERGAVPLPPEPKGPDLSERVRAKLSPEAKKVQDVFDAQTKILARHEKGWVGRLGRQARRKLLDVSGNVLAELIKSGNPDAQRAARRHDLVFGAHGAAATRIDEATKEIFSGLSAADENVLAAHLQAVRTIEASQVVAARGKELKHPGGMTPEQAQQWLDDARQVEGYGKIEKAAAAWGEVVLENLNRLHQEGILGDEAYEFLRDNHRHYYPRRFIQHMDPDITQQFGTRKITVPDSGIKALDQGSEQLLANDPRFFLSEILARSEARIKKNRANQSLAAFARAQPDNGIVREAKIVRTTKEGRPVFEAKPKGMEAVRFLEGGQVRVLFMPRSLAEEWVSYSPEISAGAANVLRWVSLSPVVKAVATGYNPGFALTNVPRDVGLVWFASDWLYKETGTRLYSPHLPVFLTQIAADMAHVAKDVAVNGPMTQQAAREGLFMEFLTHQGQIGRHPLLVKTERVSSSLSTAGQVLGWAGEKSEILTRMALRERAMKNGADSETATWIARAYLDFAKGGGYTKMADSAIPYLNAATQGFRSSAKAAAANPANFAYKVFQLGGAASGLALISLLLFREMWKRIPEDIKNRYFIIPLPAWAGGEYKDKKGQTRYRYLTVSKPEVIRPFASVFEATTEGLVTGDVPWKRMYGGLSDVGDIVPLGKLPPSVSAYFALAGNYDVWRQQQVWRGPSVEPGAEYTAYTHPLWRWMGDTTGLSPERMASAVGDIIPPYNPYVLAAMHATELAMKGAPEESKEAYYLKLSTDVTGISRVLRTTPAYTKDQELEQIRVSENTRRHKQNIDLAERVAEGEPYHKIMQGFVMKQPREDRDRLRSRAVVSLELRGVDPWWLDLREMPPLPRAQAFLVRFRATEESERKNLILQARRVPGVWSKNFASAFRRFRAEAESVNP